MPQGREFNPQPLLAYVTGDDCTIQ